MNTGKKRALIRHLDLAAKWKLPWFFELNCYVFYFGGPWKVFLPWPWVTYADKFLSEWVGWIVNNNALQLILSWKLCISTTYYYIHSSKLLGNFQSNKIEIVFSYVSKTGEVLEQIRQLRLIPAHLLLFS